MQKKIRPGVFFKHNYVCQTTVTKLISLRTCMGANSLLSSPCEVGSSRNAPPRGGALRDEPKNDTILYLTWDLRLA